MKVIATMLGPLSTKSEHTEDRVHHSGNDRLIYHNRSGFILLLSFYTSTAAITHIGYYINKRQVHNREECLADIKLNIDVIMQWPP